MAGQKSILAQLVNRHDSESNWSTYDPVPKQGEIIVYDKDTSYSYVRMKIGDGVTRASELPFIHAGYADKLIKPSTITFAGAISATLLFDGSQDYEVQTALGEYFEKISISGYIPEGTITGTVTPAGAVTAPDITVTEVTDTQTIVTSPTTQGLYTPGSCEFPEITSNITDDGILEIGLSDGKYTPGVYTPGSLGTTTRLTYLKSISATASTPKFTGEISNISATFTGTKKDITGSCSFSSESNDQ